MDSEECNRAKYKQEQGEQCVGISIFWYFLHQSVTLFPPAKLLYLHRPKAPKWKMFFNTPDIFWYCHLFLKKNILTYLLNKAYTLMDHIRINQYGLSQELCQSVTVKCNGVLHWEILLQTAR